jgi:hypothetical protein
MGQALFAGLGIGGGKFLGEGHGAHAQPAACKAADDCARRAADRAASRGTRAAARDGGGK